MRSPSLRVLPAGTLIDGSPRAEVVFVLRAVLFQTRAVDIYIYIYIYIYISFTRFNRALLAIGQMTFDETYILQFLQAEQAVTPRNYNKFIEKK